jgi:hypothetical protein
VCQIGNGTPASLAAEPERFGWNEHRCDDAAADKQKALDNGSTR